jgi:acyl-CoA dehydrogenase
MVDFEWTEEMKALKDLARKFAEKEMIPKAPEFDKTGEFPIEIVKKAYEVGLMNTVIPVEYGGGGLTSLETCVITEELAAGCAGMTTTISANTLATIPILIAGNEEQKMTHLGKLTSSPSLAAFCLTEPGAGSDAGAMRTKAVRDGDEYVVNGQKCFITNGGYASLYSVFAITDKEKGVRGISAFIVPRDLPGVSIGKHEDKMGQRASNTTEVIFEDVRIPKEYLLGKEGDGFKIAMMTLDETRAHIGSMGVGLARAALEAAIKYSKERVQFGQPIANFQATQWKLANMAIKVETARLITWYAAWLTDKKMRNTYESSIAKTFATDTAMEVSMEAVQIFGGYGYMKDFPVEKYMRDAKLLQIYEGTNEIQRVVISRELLSR